MQIWSYTNSPPQHIGNTAGDCPLPEIIERAHKARHATVKVAAYIWDHGEKRCYVFDSEERFDEFVERNAGLGVTEKAVH